MKGLMEYWEVFAWAIAGIAGYFGASKIRKTTAFENMQKSYDLFTEHQKQKLSQLKDEVSEIKKENLEHRKNIMKLQEDGVKLHKEISELTKKNADLKIVCNKLKLENDKLKENIRWKD